MSGMTSERLRAITYDMNTRPNVTITDRYHARELLAEVKRLRAGIEEIRDEVWEPWLNRDWQQLDGIRNDCNALLNPPTEGETDAVPE